ncbi:MAG: FecR domain-containing protein [Planctomycetales bacterium]|nr:FecR domain-containing protein [Planctomycetales bacterium]
MTSENLSQDEFFDAQALVDEVLELTLAWQQSTATEEQRARLERLLLDSEAARVAYIAIVDDSATLALTADGASLCEQVVADLDRSLAPTAVEQSDLLISARRQRRGEGKGWRFAVAASLLAFAAWQTSDQWGGWLAADATPTLARIVNLTDVQWHPGDEPRQAWSELRAGETLRFDRGMIEVVIDESVQLVMEGPADLDFVSPRRAVARRGKLVARVGPQAIGFEIETPQANVKDLGTEFSLSVTEDEQTDVVVYSGKVDLDVRGGGSNHARRLATGEAMRVAADGQLGRITSVHDRSFLPPPRLGSVIIHHPQLIASVTDNISLDATAKFYRIVGGSLEDDSPAYVDRLHQWNGVNESGIPPFLRGADYVMGYNDDKVLPDLRVSVDLQAPASLYVFWDDRVPPPSWLSRNFADTGATIGLDEGFEAPGDDTGRTRGVGSGQSIDQVCSVWRRDVLRAGVVVLGPVREDSTDLEPRSVAASMYGIAAQPLSTAPNTPFPDGADPVAPSEAAPAPVDAFPAATGSNGKFAALPQRHALN